MVNIKQSYKARNNTNRKNQRSFKMIKKHIKSKKNKKGGSMLGEQITLIVRTSLDENEIHIPVFENAPIYESICKELSSNNIDCEKMLNVEIYFNGELLDNNLETTFNEQSIEDGAGLSIQLNQMSFEEVLDDIIKLNPDIDEEELRSRVQDIRIHPVKPLHIEGDLNFRRLGISVLPESFGHLTIRGNIYFAKNNLTNLPNSFANLNIKGDLMLNHNRLTQLPHNFGNLEVDGDLDLGYNQLNSRRSWPKKFEQLVVRGDLYLGGNQPKKSKKSDYPNVTGQIYLV